ncbi:MAG: hypothetical protein GF383_13755 [Candidatus Lokiarchaeota archaeon]|nr:hypothetical protein [Candidatus Lokiarchaeota archaeon]MBD3342331.1 hypothetical protein [Candidatus Lokiarchaeota archaeon]
MISFLTIIIGIVLALISTLCFNMAIIFQKKGLIEGPEIVFDEGVNGIVKAFKKFFRNKWWMAGAVLGVFGWFPYIFSIGSVGIIITEPVMGIGIVVFVFAAVILLKEQVTWFEYMALGLLAISPVLIALARIKKVNIDFNQLIFPLSLFLLIVVSGSVLCFIIAKIKKDTSLEALFIMFTGSTLFATGGVFTNILAQALIQAEVKITWYILFEIGFGILWGDFYHTWVFIGFWGMATFNLSSFVFYQSGLQKGKALVMYPILDSFALVIPIIAGLFVFQQTFENYILFFIATGMIFVGILILSRFQAEIEKMDKNE